jgi:hypothetical protein
MKAKYVKAAMGLAAAVGVLGVCTAPALAAEFESTGGASRGVGVSKAEEFKVYPMTVVCPKTETKGTVPAGKFESFADEIKYTSCTTFSGLLKVAVSPAHFEYNANGTVTLLEPITITPSVFRCHYEIPAQSGFSKESLFYSDVAAFSSNTKKYPNGQLKIQIESVLQGIHYTAHGWPCTGPKSPPEVKEGKELEEEGEEGKFSGKIEEGVPTGNLTWLKE